MGAITVEGGPLTHSMGLSQVNFDFKLIFFKLVGWFPMSFVFWG